MAEQRHAVVGVRFVQIDLGLDAPFRDFDRLDAPQRSSRELAWHDFQLRAGAAVLYADPHARRTNAFAQFAGEEPLDAFGAQLPDAGQQRPDEQFRAGLSEQDASPGELVALIAFQHLHLVRVAVRSA